MMLDNIQTMPKQQMQTATNMMETAAENIHAAALESVGFMQDAMERRLEHTSKLLGVTNPGEIMSLNVQFLQTSMERWMAQTKRIGEIYSRLATDIMKSGAQASETAAQAVNDAANQRPS